jgi:S1-C subfamily serine protease
LIGSNGELIGIGSLQLQEGREQGPPGDINMIVPIDLLKPIFDDLMTLGRPGTPPRPWLGLYATEIEDKVVIVGLAKDGPAQRADLRTGDVLLSVAGSSVRNLAGLYRRVWSLGAAGVEVPFSIYRDGKTLDARIKTGDRNRFLKAPKLH